MVALRLIGIISLLVHLYLNNFILFSGHFLLLPHILPLVLILLTLLWIYCHPKLKPNSVNGRDFGQLYSLFFFALTKLHPILLLIQNLPLVLFSLRLTEPLTWSSSPLIVFLPPLVSISIFVSNSVPALLFYVYPLIIHFILFYFILFYAILFIFFTFIPSNNSHHHPITAQFPIQVFTIAPIYEFSWNNHVLLLPPPLNNISAILSLLFFLVLLLVSLHVVLLVYFIFILFLFYI